MNTSPLDSAEGGKYGDFSLLRYMYMKDLTQDFFYDVTSSNKYTERYRANFILDQTSMGPGTFHHFPSVAKSCISSKCNNTTICRLNIDRSQGRGNSVLSLE